MGKWLRRKLTLAGRLFRSFSDPQIRSLVDTFNQLNDEDQVYMLNHVRLMNRWDDEHPDQTITADETRLLEAEAKRQTELEMGVEIQRQSHLRLLEVDAYNREAFDALVVWAAAHPDQTLSASQVSRLEASARRRASWWVFRQRFKTWLHGRDLTTIQRRSQADWDALYDELSPSDTVEIIQQIRDLVGAGREQSEHPTPRPIDVRLELTVLRGLARWQAAHPGQFPTLPDQAAIRAEARPQPSQPEQEE